MREKIKVMVNGMPGKMATKVAEAITKSNDFELIPFSLTGPEISDDLYRKCSFQPMPSLIFPNDKERAIKNIKRQNKTFLSVDYTLPTAVNENIEFYTKHNLPFVMGTTGGYRDNLKETLFFSKIPAVIATNMSKPIVLLQAMLEYAAQNFPNALKDFSLDIVESHQKAKVDTSGTAKAITKYFYKLGINFNDDNIKMIRDRKTQKQIGVPALFLDGHGWHNYNILSKDKTVNLCFVHNVNGRDTYVDGTLDALRFLWKKVKNGERKRGKMFTMIDVLREGI